MLRKAIHSILDVQSPSPYLQQRARVVVVLALGMIVVALLFVPIVYFFHPHPTGILIIQALAIILFGCTIVLEHSGHIIDGIILLLCILIGGPLVVITGARWLGSTPLALLFSIAISGLLLQPGHIWRVLFIDLIGLYLAVTYYTATGSQLTDYDTSIVVIMPIVLLMTTLIGYLGARTIQQERTALQSALAEQRQVEIDLLQAKDAAEAANRAKSAFLAHMSHELRTPLTAILGYTNLLSWQASTRGDQDYQTDLAVIEHAGKHLLNLINNVLDLSKIEAGKLDFAIERFNIAELLRDLGATVQPLIAKNGNRLVINCSPEIGEMCADPTKMRQILINMLSNAAKYTEQGTITINVNNELEQDIEWMLFSVSDTGLGIPSEALSQLFQSFKRVIDPPNATKYDGAGLGLALSQHICRMMGGEITVTSTLNVGTTFVIRLPRLVVQPITNEVVNYV